MLDVLQHAVVELYRSAIQQEAPEDRLQPVTVRPYGGELLALDRLALDVPAVYVEFDDGEFTPIGTSVGRVQAELPIDLIVAASNHAGWEARAHDGARLVSWCIDVAKAAAWKLSTTPAATVTKLYFRRLVADRTIWAAQLTLLVKTA